MGLRFGVEYDSGITKFDALDGYYGAQSLLGVNQLLLISLSAFLNGQVITQATAAKGIRLVLRPSTAGCFHQALELITDPTVTGVLADLGKDALYDLLKFGFRRGVGLISQITHKKAQPILLKLERQTDDWQEKVEEPLLRIHAPTKHQGYNIRLLAGRTELIEFDEQSLEYLESEVVDEDIIGLEMCISRFNARTGTGRMISAIDSVSYPFAPEKELSDHRRAMLADNLGKVARGQFDPLKVYVSQITSNDGRLKRYVLHGAEPT